LMVSFLLKLFYLILNGNKIRFDKATGQILKGSSKKKF
jgi:hypothetical protein